MASRTPLPTSQAWHELIVFFGIVVASFLFLGSFQTYQAARDLMQYDENLYLSFALHGTINGHLVGEWAPAYALMLRALNALTHDSLTTYYLGGYLCSISVAPIWYLFARSVRVPTAWSALSAAAWMVAAGSLQWVRVSLVCTLVLWVFLAAAARQRDPARSWAIVLFGLVVSSFIRPELFWAFLLAIGIATAHLRVRATSWRAIAATTVPAAIVMGLICWRIGLPIHGTRTAMAFNQHVAFWLANRGHALRPGEGMALLANSGLLENGILSFVRHHPRLMLEHMLDNLRMMVTESPWTAMLPPEPLFAATRGFAAAPFVATVLGGLGWRLRMRRWSPLDLPLPIVVGLGLPAAITIASCLVIYPWPRYFAIVIAAVLIALLPRDDEATSARQSFLVAALIMIFAAVLPSYGRVMPVATKDMDALILGLREWQDHRPLRVFDTFHWTSMHLQPEGSRTVPAQGMSLEEPLRAHAFDVIVLTELGDQTESLRNDPAWAKLRSDPASFGYQCVHVPNTAVGACVLSDQAAALAEAFRKVSSRLSPS